MPPVQFNSYAGGPHGLGPVVLPQRQSILGNIGSFLNEVGKVPGEMQQSNLKYQLNDLLMRALTTPQTKSETIPGKEIELNSPSGAGAGIDPLGLAEPGASYGSMMTEPVTREVPNPEYQATIGRLSQVGPAFNMKFPTPLENIIAAQYAKGLGQSQVEQERQAGREKIQGMKGEQAADLQETRGTQRLDQINRQYGEGENRSTLQARRLEAQAALKDKDLASRTEHDKTIERIATNRELSQDQRTKNILAEKERQSNASLAVRQDFNNILRSTAQSTADLRQAEIDNKIVDNIVAMRSQINLLTQQAKDDPSVQTQLQGAIGQYNALVDQANSNPNAPRLDYWKLEEETGIRNFLRNLDLYPGEPTQRIVPGGRPSSPAGPPPTKPRTNIAPQPPTSKPLENKPMSGTPDVSGTITKKTETFRPGELSDEEVARRRAEIFGELESRRKR